MTIPPDDDRAVAADDASAARERWLRQAPPFCGEPFRDFVPPGALSAISRLIGDPALDWPWPYSSEEAEAIARLLPDNRRNEASQKIVYAARVYLGKTWAQLAGPKSKPDTAAELRALKDDIERLLQTIRAVSDDARRELEGQLRLHFDDAPDLLRVQHTLDAFLHSHRMLRALPEPQKIERRGRRPETEDREFQSALDEIFRFAFDGRPPKRGFPAFASAVEAPLKGWLRSSVADADGARHDRRRSPSRSTERRIKSQKSDI